MTSEAATIDAPAAAAAAAAAAVAVAPAGAADPGSRPESFLTLVWEALRGERQDFTRLPLRRAILLLAVPMVLEMLMESLFAVADIFWVSKLGPDAVATVVLTESMLIIVYAFAMGLSIGGAAVVARRIGEKDPRGAARAAVQVMMLGVCLGVVVGLGGVLFGPELLAAMGASPAVVAVGGRFTQVMLGGSVTVILLFLINGSFRGAGDATVAMRTLWLANGINIALGPALVFGWGPFPELGVTGAAVATTIGRGVGVLYQLRALTAGRGHLAVRREHLRLDGRVLATILRLSGTGIFQVFIATSSWMGLVRIVTGFGSAAVAGYGIAIRVVLFALLPSWGMANAAATLVGQNLGAGRADRAEQAVWRASLYNLVFLGVAGLLFVGFADTIVSGFSPNPEVIAHGARALRIISAGFLFYAYGMVVTQAFNGAGDTWTPTLINLFCYWLLEIPLAWTLARPLGLGPTGVFVSVLVAFSTMAVVSVALFRRGRWRRVSV
jgi:putative MATE family efflux protein